MLASPSPGISRHAFMQYHKQLVASRTIAFHQQTLRMVEDEGRIDPAVKREMVIKRVARELWINFTARGQDTPMLRHLCAVLRQEYGESLEFHYEPGGCELLILRRGENGLTPVPNRDKVDMINRAWKIALDVVDSYVAR